MIVIPNVKKATDNTGIVKAGGYYYARYKHNDTQCRKMLGPVQETLTAARVRRNEFYKKLVKHGATVATRTNRAAKVEKDPDKYIRKRLPFVVTIGNKVIGEFGTRKEARAARDAHLGLKP